ncbi:MAG TPA: hypothetical protein VGV06_20955 [Methylomirabilota bacterium]|nr:hypothetical protein [Methylomirabilota bacterium]
MASRRSISGIPTAVSLEAIYRRSLGILLALFPLSMFVAMWRMDFGPVEACCGAMVAPLLSMPSLYNLGLESYLWVGKGLYTQLFASVLAPLAFAETYRAVRTGRRLALAAALIAATFLSHLECGYILGLSALSLVLGPHDRGYRVARLAMILAATGLAESYFLVPAVRDSAFANQSVWEEAATWDSLGARVVLSSLVRGELLDHGRWPVLTGLALVGLVWAIWRGPLCARPVAGLAVVWTLRDFGRATWGWLIDMLPFSSDFPMHRFIRACSSLCHSGRRLPTGIRAAIGTPGAVAHPRRPGCEVFAERSGGSRMSRRARPRCRAAAVVAVARALHAGARRHARPCASPIGRPTPPGPPSHPVHTAAG